MKLKQRILFIPVFIILIYGIYTTVIKIQANRQRRAEILAQIAADELKYNQGAGYADSSSYSSVHGFTVVQYLRCIDDLGFIRIALEGKIIAWVHINRCTQKHESISKTNSQTKTTY